MRDPNFNYEKKLWRQGFKCVLGVDEVGRGSWAGPVVAAAVTFSFARSPVGFHPHPTSSSRFAGDAGARWGTPAPATPRFSPLDEILKLGINDSKALRSRKRTKLADKIKDCSLSWGIAEVGVGMINRLGIGQATQVAMRKAIKSIMYQVSGIKENKNRLINTLYLIPNTKYFVLVDAFHIKYLKGIGLKHQKAIIHGDQKSISIAAASILAKVYRDNLMKRLARKHPRYGWGRNKGYGTKEHQEAILKHGVTHLHRKKFVETFLKKVTL